MQVSDEGTLIFTIGSGASENAIAERQAPQLKTTISAGSQARLVYTSARSEKAAAPRATEGHRCMLNVQVAGGHGPFISVSQRCDAGHRAVFKSHGGHMQHGGIGQNTAACCDNNVNRMEGQMLGSLQTGFTWQGKRDPLGTPSL